MSFIRLLWAWVSTFWRLPLQRFRIWRATRNATPLGAIVVVQQITVDCQEWLDMPISGALFSELSMARLSIPVRAGDSIVLQMQNVGTHRVLFRGCAFITCADGPVEMVPLANTVMVPGQVVEVTSRVLNGGFLSRLIIPTLTSKAGTS